MGQTPNYGLYTTSSDDTQTNLIEWIQNINGTSSGSNMMKLDALLADMETKKANIVIESVSQPEGMGGGDEWDKVLP